MISKSFDTFIKDVYSKFTLDELMGVVTKRRMDQIILNIRNDISVNEEFFINCSDKEENPKDWYGLKVEWNEKERSGVLIAKDLDGTNWYQFNLGSLHLNRLYELVPDMDELEKNELKAMAEEEILDSLMKWKR